MPPAARTGAAAPPPSCLRARRTLGAWRDEAEPPHHEIEVRNDFLDTVGLRDVLGQRVERAVSTPGVEDVPLVGALIGRVDGHGRSGYSLRPTLVAEARDLRPDG